MTDAGTIALVSILAVLVALITTSIILMTTSKNIFNTCPKEQELRNSITVSWMNIFTGDSFISKNCAPGQNPACAFLPSSSWYIYTDSNNQMYFQSRPRSGRYTRFVLQNNGDFVSECINPASGIGWGTWAGSMFEGTLRTSCPSSTSSAECKVDGDCSNTSFVQSCTFGFCQPNDLTGGPQYNYFQVGTWTIYPELVYQGATVADNIWALVFITSVGKRPKYRIQDDGNFIVSCPCPYNAQSKADCSPPYSDASIGSGFNQQQTVYPNIDNQNVFGPGQSGNGCSFPCNSNTLPYWPAECTTNTDCSNVDPKTRCAGNMCIPTGTVGFKLVPPASITIGTFIVNEDSNQNLVFTSPNGTTWTMLANEPNFVLNYGRPGVNTASLTQNRTANQNCPYLLTSYGGYALRNYTALAPGSAIN